MRSPLKLDFPEEKPYRLRWAAGPLWLGTLLLLQASTCIAGLGGSETSVKADRQALRSRETKVMQRNDYTIHEMTLSGRTVREYVSPSGVVFAVTWRGISQPDLSVLLGSYFEEYRDAVTHLKDQRKGNPRSLRSRNLVVERSGHMRDIRGRAYVPDLVPEGFRLEEIRG